MTLSGSRLFHAPRDRVWRLFTDPQVLARSTPGCERLDPVGDDEYEAILSVGISAIKGTFKGRLALVDKTPPEGYTLRIEGSGAPGFVKGEGRLTLEEQADGTLVTVDGQAQVGGLIASVGQRLIGSAARHLMEQFFSALEREVGKEGAA